MLSLEEKVLYYEKEFQKVDYHINYTPKTSEDLFSLKEQQKKIEQLLKMWEIDKNNFTSEPNIIKELKITYENIIQEIRLLEKN